MAQLDTQHPPAIAVDDQSESTPPNTFGALYPDVWAPTFDVVRHAIALCAECQCSAEDEVGYREILLHTLGELSRVLHTLLSRVASFPTHQEESVKECLVRLEELLAHFSRYFKDLATAVVDEGLEDGAVPDTGAQHWQLTSGEVETYVQEADELMAKCDRFQTRFEWSLHGWRAARAPARLLIYKLRTLQDKMHLTPALGPALDTKEVRAWLQHCDNFHTDHCSQNANSSRIFEYRPKWLIDVQRLCLVPAHPHRRYIALSYVWGQRGAAFKTKRRNLDRVQREGSLQLPGGSIMAYPNRDSKLDNDIWRLPSVIHSAINLVKNLGEHHLWVDSLCIVQDDEEEKQEHLLHMGSIYANAYFTLVSTAGTAFTYLPGVQGYPFKRVRRPAEYARYPSSLHREIRLHHRRLQASPWSGRGWTFQEQIFSRRLLVFSEEGVTWECHCAVWFEGMPLENEPCKASTDMVAQGFYASSEPRFEDYATHVTEYNRRELTYPEDGLDAISGVLGILSTVFDGGFIAGLPILFFDEALLWTNTKPLQRRQAKLERGREKVTPTWSWAAWAGDIEFGGFAATAKSHLKPLVQWRYAARADQDWQCLPVATNTGQILEGPTNADSSTARRHDIRPPTFTPSSPSHLLYCYAKIAFFKATKLSPTKLILGNSSGVKVGTVTPCEGITPTPLSTPVDPDESLNAKEDGGEQQPEHLTCEIIAISETIIDNAETYNILWIEREDSTDFARRKGVGSISKVAFLEGGGGGGSEGENVEIVLA